MQLKHKKIIVTGGAGFIGTNLVRYLIENTDSMVINIDLLTYAGNLYSLKDFENHPRYRFKQADISDQDAMKTIFDKYEPDAIMHLAAESHVDRSIDNPVDFLKTNIMGTYTLLEISRLYWMNLPDEKKDKFRFLHVSTDEVFGSLPENGYFTESTPYDPKSPYSSSKAASDHLVRAWNNTFGLPILITNCSNNYGPYQYPEKLIPVVIHNAIKGNPIPVYGEGKNIRDWLYVEDHVRALTAVLIHGCIGETYLIGGHNEITNLELVQTICKVLDDINENATVKEHASLIEFVKDRPGHDMRYAIDPSKIEEEISWKPLTEFQTGITKTINWYMENTDWVNHVLKGKQ
ncbi:dTDP-glucose 4,6-dehydratase, partial [Calditrichota bacterium]